MKFKDFGNHTFNKISFFPEENYKNYSKTKIKIFVVDSKNNKEGIEIYENDNIKKIKEILSDKFGVNKNMILQFNGEILEDYQKVSEYEIEENDVIISVGTFHYKNYSKTKIKITVSDSKNKRVTIEIYENDNIKKIKEILSDKFGVNKNMILHYNAEILEDYRKVSEYEIEENDVIVFIGSFRK